MKKPPLSKSKSEVKKSTGDLFHADSYRRKARKMVMHLQQFRRNKDTTRRKTLLPNQPAVNLEPLSYQARFGALPTTRKEGLEGLVMLDRFAEITWKTLEEALGDPEAEVRAKAAQLLSTYPPPLPESVLEKLIECAWDPELIVRRVVARTLSFHPDPRSIGPLMGLLGSRDDELRDIVEASLTSICTELGPPPPASDGDT